jgi:hypothetical protein
MTSTDGVAMYYRILIRGHLDPTCTAWFDELTLTQNDDGTTELVGPPHYRTSRPFTGSWPDYAIWERRYLWSSSYRPAEPSRSYPVRRHRYLSAVETRRTRRDRNQDSEVTPSRTAVPYGRTGTAGHAHKADG